MRPFELFEPTTLPEALALLDPDDPSVRPLSGGTALMLMMKTGVFQPSRLVSLQRLEPRFSRIEAADGAIRIGALASLSAVEHDPEIGRHLPVIPQTMRTLSNVRVRNVARVGGGLAHGDPNMDMPPVLAALGAAVVTAGPKGARTIPVEDLYSGYYQTVLERNELIAEVLVPTSQGRNAAYLKCTTRSADDWPALGLAAVVPTESGLIRGARLVLSAATERPVRLASSESVLEGSPADDATLRRAAEAACDEAELIPDARGTVAYKRELLRVYVVRAVRAALANGSGLQ